MKFLVIGKSRQMESMLLRHKITGKFYQKPIRLGIRLELDEAEITDHVRRQEALKVIQIVPIEEEKPKEQKATKSSALRTEKKAELEEPELVKSEVKEEEDKKEEDSGDSDESSSTKQYGTSRRRRRSKK